MALLGDEKVCNAVKMLMLGCSKRKDVRAQGILQYTIYGRYRDMGG